MTKDLKFLLNIVNQAEAISKEHFVVKEKKGSTPNDLVTNLDLKIEKFLISKINEEYPNFDIVSEETNSKKEVSKNCFTIDPIDGTINFANGLPLWGIQLACVKNGKTVAAVIDMPKMGYLFYADKNGAFLNGEKIQVRQVPLKNALYCVDCGRFVDVCNNIKKYGITGFRRTGAICASMAFVAAGWFHGVVYLSEKPWDYYPGLFITKMAGASTLSEKGFRACAMNDELLNILKECTKEQ